MPTIAGHAITTKQLVALHGLYKDVIRSRNGQSTVYGVNVQRQLDALADKGVIARGGMGYFIPYDSPGAAIVQATPDFAISTHI